MRIEAGAGHGNISKPRIDDVGVYRGIYIYEHRVGGEALGAAAGDSSGVINAMLLPWMDVNLAVVFK